MSGTGGTVYDPTPPISKCERLTFRTVLNSPVPEVIEKIRLAKLSNNVILDIFTENRGNLRIAVAIFNSERAGAITSDALLRLLECMENNHEYVAEVLAISGARVEIQVAHK